MNTSIVMAVYNDEKHIGNCIKSVLFQTYSDFEFIIVDDASTDKTSSIVQDYSRKDNRIKYLRNKVNSKQAYSRNRAIKVSRGSNIAIIDSDCEADKNWLKNLIEGLTKSDVVIGRSYGTKESKWAKIIDFKHQKALSKKNSEDMDYFDTRNCAFKKSVIDKVGYFDDITSPAEDFDLGIRIRKAGYKIKEIKEASLLHHDPTKLKTQFKWTKQRAIPHYIISKKYDMKFNDLKESKYFNVSILFLFFSLLLTLLIPPVSFLLFLLFLLFFFLGNKFLFSHLWRLIRFRLKFSEFLYILVRDLGNKYGGLLRLIKIHRL